MTGKATAGLHTSGLPVGTGPVRKHTTIVCLFVASAMIFGGGGSSAPFSELALQLLAALALAAWLLVPGKSAVAGQSRPTDRKLLVLAGLVLLLPCVQLVPLPPSVWQHLPGRDQERAALELVGAGEAWMPWSVAPARTFASLLALLPPLLAMGMVAALDRAGRYWVIATIAAVALVSLLLGALQLSAGTAGAWRLYDADNLGFLNGFQANRNAQADILLAGLVASAAALRGFGEGRRSGVDLMLAALVVLFVIACILTGSRAGISLLPVALAAVAVIWLPRSFGMRRALLWIGGLLSAGAAGFLALRQTTAVSRVLERFAQDRDFRWELWQDTQYAIWQHWPFGTGIGTFRPVFIAAERLEVVDPTMPVRAHNEYLELALETGIFGPVLLVVAAVWLGAMALASWRRRDRASRAQIIFALALFVLVALHSVVDYPMRSMALACLAGVAAGLLSAAPDARKAWGTTGQ